MLSLENPFFVHRKHRKRGKFYRVIASTDGIAREFAIRSVVFFVDLLVPRP